MRLLVLWARRDQPNIGVRALAAGADIIARRAFPGADVRTHGVGASSESGNDGPMNLAHLPPLAREVLQPRRGLKEWLTSFDLVLDTRAGDSFADIYGPRRLVRMSALPELAHQWGVPVAMLPQTIGPFKTRRGRVLARRSLSTAALVMTRDPHSAKVAASLGRDADVISTDLVFALPRDQVARTRDVLFNPSGLLWSDNPHVDAPGYRASCQDLVDRLLREGRRVTLVPHVLGPRAQRTGDNDWLAVDALTRRFGSAVDVAAPESLDDARCILGSGRVIIGARMHACLNALSMGTPVVPMAYSRKFATLLEPLGVTSTVDVRSGRHVTERVLEQTLRTDLVGETIAALGTADCLLDKAVDSLPQATATGWSGD